MRALRLLAVLVLVVAGGLLVTPAPAYACSCAFPRTDPRLVEMADVIFTGQIIKDRSSGQVRTLTFAVDRVYKGSAEVAEEVSTHVSGASCGLEIGGSGTFLVYATGSSPQRKANLCGGTRPGPAPASLGPGNAPAGGPSSPVNTANPTETGSPNGGSDSGGGSGALTVGSTVALGAIALGAGALAAGAVVLIRRLRRPQA